jgi:hypothetical protein
MLKRDEIATLTSCLNRAADDEPIFVLRANDENAAGIVATWARDYIASKGGYTKAVPSQVKKYEEALALAGQMRVWRMQNRK